MPRKPTQTSAKKLISREREVDAINLRKQGYSYRKIGETLGVSDVAAYKIVKRVMDRTIKKANEEVDAAIQMELIRLDALLVKIWPNAADKGDLFSVDRVLKISERRAKLLGLDAPVRSDLTTDGEKLLQPTTYIEVVKDYGPNGESIDNS